MLITIIGNVLFAVTLLFLISAGLAIIFGVLRIVNFAHGDFLMIGALTCALAQENHIPFVLAAVFGTFASSVLGFSLSAFGLTRVGRDVTGTTGLLVTWAYGTVIRNAVAAIFGTGARFAAVPVTGSIMFFGGSIPLYTLTLLGIGLLVGGTLLYLFEFTELGRRLRATVEDRQMAEGVGINTRRIDIAALLLGGGLAGLAGALVSPLVYVEPFMGIDYILRAFLTVLAGGLGSLVGAGVASAGIGSLETGLTVASSPIVAELAVFVVVALVLIIRSGRAQQI